MKDFPWLVDICLLGAAHSPASGGVCDLTSISATCSVQPSVEPGRLPLGESANVTLSPRPLPFGTGLPSLESLSMDISLCKKPSFFLLTKPVLTLPSQVQKHHQISLQLDQQLLWTPELSFVPASASQVFSIHLAFATLLYESFPQIFRILQIFEQLLFFFLPLI